MFTMKYIKFGNQALVDSIAGLAVEVNLVTGFSNVAAVTFRKETFVAVGRERKLLFAIVYCLGVVNDTLLDSENLLITHPADAQGG